MMSKTREAKTNEIKKRERGKKWKKHFSNKSLETKIEKRELVEKRRRWRKRKEMEKKEEKEKERDRDKNENGEKDGKKNR